MISNWPTIEEIRNFQQMPHAYLEAKASAFHLTGISNIEVPTSAGKFGLGASAFGVTSIYFPGFEDYDISERMSKHGLAFASWGHQRAIEAGLELMGYFLGEVKKFESPIDLSYMTPFQQDVLGALTEVPYGEKITYGELAAKAGHPGKYRAVGNCMKHNPVPIMVPCHRVTASSGALGGWSGPEGWKEELLALERGY